MIDRRGFLHGAALAMLAAPRIADARPVARTRLPRIGVIGEVSPVPWTVRTAVADIECRWAGSRRENLPALAAELVGLAVDVIVAAGAGAARAARNATRTIPIVFVSAGDPVAQGLVASMERPGSNATGLATPSDADMAHERLALLARATPGLRRIAVLANRDDGLGEHSARQVCAAAPRHGLEALIFDTRSPEDIETAFAAMRAARMEGVVVLADALFAMHAHRIVALAAAHHLSAVYGARSFVEAGGLMALSGDTAAMIRRTASIVSRVLAGADPATLPVERLARSDLSVNLTAARALGLSLPRSLLTSADAVIGG